ncbi:hypothetical protein ACGF0J_21765 [Nonomuraea sp. NPDC047897]|uniref:hypothetical protein n=1 Tax=Nonomuraea sp. NPDC047897 TaxID=3364346 RepID=UPI003722D82F
MTHQQIAARLRGIAARRPTDIWRELHALAMELEQVPEPVGDLSRLRVPEAELEALVRATQPSGRRSLRLGALLFGRRR